MFWARYHIKYLRMWRKATRAIARAIKDLKLDAETYVIGGAAENRLTILSDIDVLVCIKQHLNPDDAWALRKKILGLAMDRHGLPIDYPVELHIHSIDECRKLMKHVKTLRID